MAMQTMVSIDADVMAEALEKFHDEHMRVVQQEGPAGTEVFIYTMDALCLAWNAARGQFEDLARKACN